jgi:hypothetical protein
MKQDGVQCGQCGVSKAWLALGCLMALGLTVLVVRELPAVRRELLLMSM